MVYLMTHLGANTAVTYVEAIESALIRLPNDVGIPHLQSKASSALAHDQFSDAQGVDTYESTYTNAMHRVSAANAAARDGVFQPIKNQ